MALVEECVAMEFIPFSALQVVCCINKEHFISQVFNIEQAL